MASSSLLKCSICPKKPSFSDVSHLLTHVGSKGHLANLHKLQVRSHQEIPAGRELEVYDRWYQQHGLGQLLSERMLHKESRKGNKRGRATIPRHIKDDPEPYQLRRRIAAPPNHHPATRTRQLHHTRATRRSKVSSLNLCSDDDSDYDDSPTRHRSKRRTRRACRIPVKRSPLRPEEPGSDADCPGISDPITPRAGEESPRLKGILWPGMDLFDAATEGMKRRRNQKKDGSALENMERSSALVMPAEAIYSPKGTWQRTRVITGNVDDTSPLRGETPVPKPVRRRRQPLAERDSNLLRTSDQALPRKKVKGHSHHLRRGISSPSPYGRSAAVDPHCRPTSLFSPTEEEDMEFKLTVDRLRDNRKRGNFTIFNDNDYACIQNPAPAIAPDPETTRSRVHQRQNHRQYSMKRPQMQFMTTPWLQPQYQQSASYHNMYTTIDHQTLQNTSYDELDVGKENLEPSLAPFHRPPGCLASAPSGHGPVVAPDSLRNIPAPRSAGGFGLMGGFNVFDDPFGYSANPLSASFHQSSSMLGGPLFAEGHSYSVAENTREAISPDGTVSDNGEFDPSQNIFATSE